MKLIITAILLFTLGFFGTGFVVHPNSPISITKLLSQKDTVVEKEINTSEIENEQKENKTTDHKSDVTDIIEVDETNAEGKSTTAVTTSRPKVTKRPADLSKPIVLSTDFIQLTNANLTDFLADKKANVVIVGNFGSSSNPDLVDSLNLLMDQFPMKSNVYVINTESTDLTIDRGAIEIDENLRMSTSPAIYYQKAALIYYQKSLKRADYSDLYEFLDRIY